MCWLLIDERGPMAGVRDGLKLDGGIKLDAVKGPVFTRPAGEETRLLLSHILRHFPMLFPI